MAVVLRLYLGYYHYIPRILSLYTILSDNITADVTYLCMYNNIVLTSYSSML